MFRSALRLDRSFIELKWKYSHLQEKNMNSKIKEKNLSNVELTEQELEAIVAASRDSQENRPPKG